MAKFSLPLSSSTLEINDNIRCFSVSKSEACPLTTHLILHDIRLDAPAIYKLYIHTVYLELCSKESHVSLAMTALYPSNFFPSFSQNVVK